MAGEGLTPQKPEYVTLVGPGGAGPGGTVVANQGTPNAGGAQAWPVTLTDAEKAFLSAIMRSVTDFRTLIDYAGRVDGNPVYVGKNLQSAAIGAATWSIQKLFYDALGNLLDAQVLTGAWTGRAALAWKPVGGD